ncbi:XylR family transcriptional regulator [Aeoliella sp. SH292]|uniref:XylR family transcriptional regulator n=1 Tax=Aeoliella sp. SH292 TaxID=3454464 RepID=UPI003F9A9A16
MNDSKLRRPQVALDIETSRVYGRRILQGISRYLVAHRPWSIYVEQHEIGSGVRSLLSRWKGDGIITRQATPDDVRLLRRRGLAVVDLSNFLPPFGIPRISSADRAIGRLAANHFLERGFTNFGCCGFAGQHWSQQRREDFASAVQHSGYHCEVLEQTLKTRAQQWERDQDEMASWLARLPKPVAVLATNDLLGHHVLDACARASLLVPEEIAVLGVDNDELLCNLCSPSLSSVIPDPERIGFEAASWLDRIMDGEVISNDAVLEVPAIGLAIRQSSDILAVDDPDVASALKYIRDHACEGTSVNDVVKHLAVSRSWLERAFRKHLKRSPQGEIRNIQVRRCKELLSTTELPLEKIASLSGFRHPEYMSVVFKRETCQTPGQYRAQHRT